MDKTSEGLRARLKWLLETSGLSAREASKRAKQSSPAYIGMLLRGDIDDTKTRTVEDIAAVFGVTPAWLAYGDGPQPTEADVRRRAQGEDGPTVDRSEEFAQSEPTDGAL
jgi:hypothetical protein